MVLLGRDIDSGTFQPTSSKEKAGKKMNKQVYNSDECFRNGAHETGQIGQPIAGQSFRGPSLHTANIWGKRQGSHGDKKGTAKQKGSNYTYTKGHPTQEEKVDESLESQNGQSMSRTHTATKKPSAEHERTRSLGKLGIRVTLRVKTPSLADDASVPITTCFWCKWIRGHG